MTSTKPDAAASEAVPEHLLHGLERDSIASVEDAISRQHDVSAWLREAALTSAMMIGQEADIQAGVSALANLSADARARYPKLDAAIRRATGDRARLGVHLDPLNPHHSHLLIEFRSGRHFDAFRLLASLDLEAALAAVRSVVALLPETMPFPGHPHVRSSMIAHDTHDLRLTVERASGRSAGTTEAFSIDAPGVKPLRLPSVERAAEAIVQYFRYAETGTTGAAR